jgi:hypothetical protein
MSLFVAGFVGPVTGEEGTTSHPLAPLGHPAAPQAAGIAQHNTTGAALQVDLTAAGLPAGKECTLKCLDMELGKGLVDANGQLRLSVTVQDPAILRKISESNKRRFDLWQDSSRLARSSVIFSFRYTAG